MWFIFHAVYVVVEIISRSILIRIIRTISFLNISH